MTSVALIRGINVGRAKRVAMADLRRLVEGLGYGDVRTILNSGNVIFPVPPTLRGNAATCIEDAVAARLGVTARVIILTAAEVAAIVNKNPLRHIADNPSRLLVAVLATPGDRRRLTSLTRDRWTPEAFALGARVAYLWCPAGIIKSPLGAAVGRVLGDAVTMRNMATMTKLHAIVASP